MNSHCNHLGRRPCHNGGQLQVHGLVQAILLLFLSKKACHGYDLAKQLHAEFPEELVPDPAVIYRILRQLERGDYVSSQLAPGQGGPARKVYSLTSQGHGLLRQQYHTSQTRIKTLQLFCSKYEHLNSSPEEG